MRIKYWYFTAIVKTAASKKTFLISSVIMNETYKMTPAGMFFPLVKGNIRIKDLLIERSHLKNNMEAQDINFICITETGEDTYKEYQIPNRSTVVEYIV